MSCLRENASTTHQRIGATCKHQSQHNVVFHTLLLQALIDHCEHQTVEKFKSYCVLPKHNAIEQTLCDCRDHSSRPNISPHIKTEDRVNHSIG